MTTRLLDSRLPDGTTIVFIQELLPDGSWHNRSARRPGDPDLLKHMTSPSESTAKSGSSNSHARKAPSASERWTGCTASLALESESQDLIFPMIVNRVIALAPYLLGLPQDELHDYEKRALSIVAKLNLGETKVKFLDADQRRDMERTEGSVASREGTRAHDFAADVFKGKKKIADMPEEFQHHVKGYVEHCLALVPEGEFPFIEMKVPLWYSPKDRGTLDFGIVTPQRVTIRDLKFGEGKLVRNFENPQFAIYARSLIEFYEAEGLCEFEPDTIVDMAAYQPRHKEAAELKPWVITLADLRAFTQGIEDAAAVIDAGEGLVFSPSEETCQWCPCKGFCRARLDAASAALENPNSPLSPAALLAMLPDDDEYEGEGKNLTKKAVAALPVADRMARRLAMIEGATGWITDDDTMVALYLATGGITSFLKDIGELLEGRLLAGEKVDDRLKVVMGRPGNREWASEEEAERLLKQKLKIDDYAPRKVISPTKAEELLDLDNQSTKFKNLVTGNIVRSTPRRTIAPVGDKRPAVESMVDMLPEDDEIEIQIDENGEPVGYPEIDEELAP